MQSYHTIYWLRLSLLCSYTSRKFPLLLNLWACAENIVAQHGETLSPGYRAPINSFSFEIFCRLPFSLRNSDNKINIFLSLWIMNSTILTQRESIGNCPEGDPETCCNAFPKFNRLIIDIPLKIYLKIKNIYLTFHDFLIFG